MTLIIGVGHKVAEIFTTPLNINEVKAIHNFRTSQGVAMAFRLFFLLGLIFLSACDDSSSIPKTTACALRAKLIIGNLDWVDFRTSGGTSQDANEQTVAQLKVPRLQANCTGFLISDDLLMTNNHCVPSASVAVGARAVFRSVSGLRESFTCEALVLTNVPLDFSLLRCSGAPGRKYGVVRLAETPATLGDPVYVIQENCDYIRDPRCLVDKYVAFGRVQRTQKNRLYHDADTLGGSSGSPVFSELTHDVVALHNAGQPGDALGAPVNLSVPMGQITRVLRTQEILTLPPSPAPPTATPPVAAPEVEDVASHCES